MLSLEKTTWETKLLAWAQEPLDSCKPVDPILSGLEVNYRPPVLEQAYRYCDDITRSHSRTFYLASSLLSAQKRDAVRALYAFCRVSDDLVDRGNGNAHSELEVWRYRTLYTAPGRDDLVSLAWSDARLRYRIPRRYAEQLIEGVAKDIDQRRYQTFDDLASYCYGVASTVGLMAMHIIGFSGENAVPYAVKLGVALQLTNILRDVGEDWQKGRLYLPLDELADFDLTEEDIGTGCLDERWQAFLAYQIDRNRRLYAEAFPGIAQLAPDGRFAVAAAAELYQGILDAIEVNGGDVFHHRAHLSSWDKLKRLPAIWWKTNRV